MTCPLTGLPCDEHKPYRANEDIDGKFQTFRLCERCMQNYLNTESTRDEIYSHCRTKEKKRPADVLKNLLGLFSEPVSEIVKPDDKVSNLKKLNEESEKIKQQIKDAVSKEEFETASKLKQELLSLVQKKQDIEKSL